MLANPNAPTGMALTLDEVERLVQSNPQAVVIVDEAYVDFGADSAVPLIQSYPNLLVVQTASKSRALAGLRVGWAMGNSNLINALRCVRDCFNSYTVDRVAAAGLKAAMEDEGYFQSIRGRVMAARDKTARRLSDLGFTVLPSRANFLFVTYPACPARRCRMACGRRASWCGAGTTRSSPTGCGSPWAPTRRWMCCSGRSPSSPGPEEGKRHAL